MLVDASSVHVRRCCYTGRICPFSSCTFLDAHGNVKVCSSFRGQDFFASRKVAPNPTPLFSKHQWR